MGWRGPLTHRQFICWIFWLNSQKNKPSRDNYYQMQTSCEIRRLYHKKPNEVKTDDFKLIFEKKMKESNKKSAKTFKEQIEENKKRFLAFMTAPVTVMQDGKVVETIIPPLVKRNQILKERREKRKQQTIEREKQKAQRNQKRRPANKLKKKD